MKSTTLGAAFVCIAGVAGAAEMGAVDEPIKLAVNEWTGQHVSTHIAGEMLKKAGYNVEYVTAGYMNMWQAMADGELHAALEVWTSNVSDQFAKQVEETGGDRPISAISNSPRKKASPIRRMSSRNVPGPARHGRR